ncbi:MAG: hypothetical protein PHE53_09685, partial [Thermoguttaceae bacterium]|nr:hypothetical protein [Thermoguttaceae bacterium]
MKWYYRAKNSTVETGPLETANLRQLVASGEIHTEGELRQGPAGVWFPMAMFAESLSLPRPNAATPISEPSATVSTEATATPVSSISVPTAPASSAPVPSTSATRVGMTPKESSVISNSTAVPSQPTSPFDFLSTPANRSSTPTNTSVPPTHSEQPFRTQPTSPPPPWLTRNPTNTPNAPGQAQNP